jgi:hypothetical protein
LLARYDLILPPGQALPGQVLKNNGTGTLTWADDLGSTSDWGLIGNAGTNPFTHFIGTTDNQSLSIRTASTERMRITNTGAVGIGTNSPGAELDVVGQVRTSGGFKANNGFASLPSYSFVNDASTGIFLPSTNMLAFALGGIERGRFTPTGLSLGLGNSVQGVLIFNNSLNLNTVTLQPGITTTSYSLTLPLQQALPGQVLKNNGAGILSWADDLGVTSNWGLTGNAATTPGTNFIGTTDATDFVLRTSNAERLRVAASGNVGIGTNLPSVKLHVLGNYRLEDGTQGLGRLLMSDANGNASWKIFDSLIIGKVANGLYFNTTLHRIHMGGALTENTTITNGNFNYTYDLTGTGDFLVTEASNAIPSLFVSGNNGTATDGYVGIGTATPIGKFHINQPAATISTVQNTYHLLLGTANGIPDLTLGANAVFALVQSWNNKPMIINSQGNFVGINSAATPIQNLDINGRLALQSGVIQRGTTTINATTDLGLYQQTAGATIRFANNAGPIKFYTDQGGANSAGTNALMNVDNANGGAVKIHAETSGLGNAGVPSANAALDVQSTTKGVFFPRMTTAQRDAIAPAAADVGLMIYNLDENCINWWDTRTNVSGVPGFWNIQCQPCKDYFEYTANTNGNIFSTQVGSPNIVKTYCVKINAGVTLGATVAGGTALDFGTLPAGSIVILNNYGTIRGGGGNGGKGGSERDNVCGADLSATSGGNGGHAIITSANVQVIVYNYGTIAGGGGGGGGGAGGCRSNGGSGGGGAGIPGGAGGVSFNTGAKASGGGCTACVLGPFSGTAAAGLVATGGLATCAMGNAGGGCFAVGANGGCGGNGGNQGAAGNGGLGTTCGTATQAGGGAAGNALLGNGSGSTITNSGGSIFGIITP